MIDKVLRREFSMGAVNKTTIKEQVYNVLKHKILHQQYQLGEKINIDALAAELQVSNSPIREALMLLARDGLIVTVPNKGARVVSFTEKSFVEIAQTLCAMLRGSYLLCVELEKTQEIVKCMEKHIALQHNALNTHNFHELVRQSILFDKSIISASENSYFLSIYERIEDVFYLMILHNNQNGLQDCQKSIKEHEMILYNIRQNDVEQVLRWLSIHYDKHFEKTILP